MKAGDKVRLIRRFSNLNGWSIGPHLDGKIMKIVSIEDRVNGVITLIDDNGVEWDVFRGAIGSLIDNSEEGWRGKL